MSRRRPIVARVTVLATVTLVSFALSSCTDAPDGLLDAAGGGAHHGSSSAVAAEPIVGPVSPARHTGPQGGVGQFAIECEYSHSAPDDPIVHPGRPGYSHRHDFFGNTTTDAFSTLDSLLAGDTTCKQRKDTAAYWAPTLYDHGEPVTPVTGVAYYRAAPGVDPAALQNYPEDLRIIAGDMSATSPQPTDLVGWTCGTSTRQSSEPPACPDTARLRAVITFPDCWDGERTDSPGHKAHMANSSEGTCPDSHPVHVPQLTFAVTYPITGDGHDLELASGSVLTLHSDFMNAWDTDKLGREIELCLHRDVVCSLFSNRGEESLFTG